MLSAKSFGEDAKSRSNTDELLNCFPHKPFKVVQIYNINLPYALLRLNNLEASIRNGNCLKNIHSFLQTIPHRDHIFFHFQRFSKHTYLFALKSLQWILQEINIFQKYMAQYTVLVQHRRRHISCEVQGRFFIRIRKGVMALRVKESCVLLEDGSFIPTFHYIY